MQSPKESLIGICYECSTKNSDSSEKEVSLCTICNKWFCELHLKPKFPYFVDWDTVFDVQGNPEIKAKFHTEYSREGGHPDLVYLQKNIEAFELEKEARNELIKQAIDRMNNPEKYFVEKPVDSEVDRKKRIEILLKEEAEIDKHPKKEAEKDNLPTIEETLTTENKYRYNFRVPVNIYADPKYRDKLNNAKTVAEVENIIADYRKHNLIKVEEKNRKKHWWE